MRYPKWSRLFLISLCPTIGEVREWGLALFSRTLIRDKVGECRKDPSVCKEKQTVGSHALTPFSAGHPAK